VTGARVGSTTVSGYSREKAMGFHESAHDGCYVASSVNFPVRHEPTIVVAD